MCGTLSYSVPLRSLHTVQSASWERLHITWGSLLLYPSDVLYQKGEVPSPTVQSRPCCLLRAVAKATKRFVRHFSSSTLLSIGLFQSLTTSQAQTLQRRAVLPFRRSAPRVSGSRIPFCATRWPPLASSAFIVTFLFGFVIVSELWLSSVLCSRISCAHFGVRCSIRLRAVILLSQPPSSVYFFFRDRCPLTPDPLTSPENDASLAGIQWGMEAA